MLGMGAEAVRTGSRVSENRPQTQLKHKEGVRGGWLAEDTRFSVFLPLSNLTVKA